MLATAKVSCVKIGTVVNDQQNPRFFVSLVATAQMLAILDAGTKTRSVLSMARIVLVLIILFTCTTAFAGPVLFICERPNWSDKKGCGPSNVYDTYTFYTYAEAILEDQAADKETRRYLRPQHVFTKATNCDGTEGQPSIGRFEVDGQLMTLWLGDVRKGDGLVAAKVVLNMGSLKAELSGAEHGSALSCTLQIGASVSELQLYDEMYEGRFKRPFDPWSYDPQRLPPE